MLVKQSGKINEQTRWVVLSPLLCLGAIIYESMLKTRDILAAPI